MNNGVSEEGAYMALRAGLNHRLSGHVPIPAPSLPVVPLPWYRALPEGMLPVLSWAEGNIRSGAHAVAPAAYLTKLYLHDSKISENGGNARENLMWKPRF